MQPCVSLQSRVTGSGSSSWRVWAASFLLSFLPKLLLPWIYAGKWRNSSADCSPRSDNMTAQNKSMENVQCSCLSVCLSGGREGGSQNGAKTCYQPQEWFLLPLKDIDTHTQTHTDAHAHSGERGMQRLEGLPVRAFGRNSNTEMCELCFCVFVHECACERKQQETAGDREQWPVI